ncbi:MAG: energy-coupling factor transporter ATP-binding protein EcfA2, partial [Bacteriovoracaceae bacterium]
TLPNIPASNIKNSGREDLKKDFEELETVKTELKELRITTLKELTLKKNQELKLHNDLLLQVNNVRGVLYKLLPADYVLKKVTTLGYYKGIVSELTSAPFRIISFFYSKFLYIREQLSKGRAGITILAYDMAYLTFLFIIFFILKTLFSNSQVWVDKRVNSFVKNYREVRLVKISLSLWNKVKDNLEEILWLVLTSFLIDKESFSDVRLVIVVVQIILVSRILKSLVILFFGSVSRIDIKSFALFKKKAQISANHISNIYLFYSFSLVIADATIGRTYIFSIVNVTVAFYAVYRLVMMSATWEKEFWTYLERNFSGFIITRLEVMFKLVPSKVKATIYFFIIIVFSILNTFIRATENFEISKKISANIFKKQIERVEVGDGTEKEIPQDYCSHFQLQSLESEDDYVCVSEELEAKIRLEIDEWCDDKSEEHSLVVFGDKGVGKTTLIKHCLSIVEEQRSDSINIIRTKIPAKTYEKGALQNFIKELLLGKEEAASDSNFDLYHIDKKLEKKTVIFLDEAQNIFLSKTGGFGAYDALANMINFSTEKIYWVLSFNKYSWIFIDRAFGRNQFFRNVFEVRGWSDTKIKELIMTRHKKTDFRLSFDLLINATRSQDEIDRYASVESKFFKLLWELSRGNPRAALVLWLTALSQKRSKTLNVNIPREAELVGLEKLPDDLMFVLAHILKHENLTGKEIEGTTDLPTGIVRNAIKVGLEKDFLYRDQRGRYMIDISSQFGLIKFLTLKNFIYGS